MSDFKFLGNFLGKKANLSKDGHDMSAQFAYSMPFGTFNVVDAIEVVPNEHYRCKYSGYVQSAPMREDNFATIYNNMKAIFVPYTSLSRNYLNAAYPEIGTEQRANDIYKNIPAYDITCSVYQILQLMFPSYVFSRVFEHIYSLPDIDKFTVYPANCVDAVIVGADGNYIHIQDYYPDDRAIWFLQYIGFQYGQEDYPLLKLLEDIASQVRSRSGNAFCFDALRTLDSLDYGNYLPTLDRAFNEYLSKLFAADPLDGGRHFELDGDDLLIKGLFWSFANQSFPSNSDLQLGVNLRKLFAYQYYIQMVESSDYRKPTNLTIYTLDSVCQYWELHNGINHMLDVGNNVLTMNLQLSDGSSYGILLAKQLYQPLDSDGNLSDYDGRYILSWLLSSYNPLLYPDLFTTAQASVVRGSIPTINSTSYNTNFLKELTEKSALYKIREDLLRAGVRRDKQFKSLFGVSPQDNVTDDILVLDKSQTRMSITSLLNQAETSEAPLGARAARGNGSGGLDFEFDSNDFGLLIVVQYFTAELFYESMLVDKTNRIAWSSLWNHRFNNLGLESIRASECYYPAFGKGSPTAPNEIIGYSARYYEHKQRVSKARGAFTNYAFPDQLLGFGVYTDNSYVPRALVRGNSIYGGYIPTMIDQQEQNFNNLQMLRFSPYMLNNLFVTMFDGVAFGGAAYDPFRCVLDCSVHKVSPMPKLGLLREI